MTRWMTGISVALATAAVAAWADESGGAREAKGRPPGAPEYAARVDPSAGRHLALTIRKLEQGFDPPRPFLIWAIGSSYCNMLGNGEAWIEEIPKRFPRAPSIEYRKMVGNSCPWQYLRGWVGHLIVPDQPDLVLIYTIGQPDDLERLIVEIRSRTTADILVPSIHWRLRDAELWGVSENAADQDVGRVREICRRHGVEFVENRRQWGEYLAANGLPIEALLKDAVHQSDFGARIINANILAHVRRPDAFSYDPADRERRIPPRRAADGSISAEFRGTRVDLIGRTSPGGGAFRVQIDGRSADEVEAFLVSYVRPHPQNASEERGANPRDQSPHGIGLGRNIVPQSWKLAMTSDGGDFILRGSVTGPDGLGNAFRPFVSDSGQITIDPGLWRRAERNRSGDTFTFDVRRAVQPDVSFDGPEGARFSVRLAESLPNANHTVELIPVRGGAASIEAFEIFQPPI